MLSLQTLGPTGQLDLILLELTIQNTTLTDVLRTSQNQVWTWVRLDL